MQVSAGLPTLNPATAYRSFYLQLGHTYLETPSLSTNCAMSTGIMTKLISMPIFTPIKNIYASTAEQASSLHLPFNVEITFLGYDIVHIQSWGKIDIFKPRNRTGGPRTDVLETIIFLTWIQESQKNARGVLCSLTQQHYTY